MANTHVVLEGVKDYTLELLGTKARDEAVDAADRAEAQAERAEAAATRSEGAAESAMGDAAATAADRVATGEDRAQTGRDVEAAEGWASQSKDAATLAITAAATVTQYVGDGFPEGRVSAPVGAVYTDTAATAGAIRWIKARGTGNTGWQVESGDTGWRNVSSLLINGWTGAVLIRRVQGNVYTMFNDVSGANKTSNEPFSVPSGFRPSTVAVPPVNVDPRPTLHNTNSQIQRFYYRSGIDLAAAAPLVTGGLYGQTTYSTSDQWPASLPGVPS